MVERCFSECVHAFRGKSLDEKEEKCMSQCSQKFLKHSQRVGMRFAEIQQNETEKLQSKMAEAQAKRGA